MLLLVVAVRLFAIAPEHAVRLCEIEQRASGDSDHKSVMKQVRQAGPPLSTGTSVCRNPAARGSKRARRTAAVRLLRASAGRGAHDPWAGEESLVDLDQIAERAISTRRYLALQQLCRVPHRDDVADQAVQLGAALAQRNRAPGHPEMILQLRSVFERGRSRRVYEIDDLHRHGRNPRGRKATR